MILLPKCLYMFWHSPVLIPLKTFKTLDSIINTFIWGPSRHKLAWNTLKNLTSSGGVALPDFHSYYIAAQLSHFYHLHKSDRHRYQTLTCEKPGRSTHSPMQVIFRGRGVRGGADSRNRLLSHHRRVWEIALKITNADFFHSHTSLWHNPQLRELTLIPDVDIWASKGILYLHQVITTLRVRNFQSLKDEFELPPICYSDIYR